MHNDMACHVINSNTPNIPPRCSFFELWYQVTYTYDLPIYIGSYMVVTGKWTSLGWKRAVWKLPDRPDFLFHNSTQNIWYLPPQIKWPIWCELLYGTRYNIAHWIFNATYHIFWVELWNEGPGLSGSPRTHLFHPGSTPQWNKSDIQSQICHHIAPHIGMCIYFVFVRAQPLLMPPVFKLQ